TSWPRDWSSDVCSSDLVLAERGELRAVPGVGDAIADKTREILATGTTQLYERLKKEVPESLTELLELRGFGSRKVNTVWQELGRSEERRVGKECRSRGS